MLIKRKSLIVGLVSSIVIALVLITTLVGYFIYLELKSGEFGRVYQELLEKAKAKVYSKHLDIFGLDARIENTGALKGKPIIEGAITNNGPRDVANLVIKLSFLDRDSASIYELTAHPQEPALGGTVFTRVYIPHLYSYTHPTAILKPAQTLKFKKIIAGCPTEVFVELREGEKPTKSFGRWSGKLIYEVISLDLL
ncbi:MAG: hypothetical protein Q8R14_02810 [Candidatus Omnitrophota bacterium]|nr:hypothetical protein [Candidatus Omnitrophota bacterium]